MKVACPELAHIPGGHETTRVGQSRRVGALSHVIVGRKWWSRANLDITNELADENAWLWNHFKLYVTSNQEHSFSYFYLGVHPFKKSSCTSASLSTSICGSNLSRLASTSSTTSSVLILYGEILT